MIKVQHFLKYAKIILYKVMTAILVFQMRRSHSFNYSTTLFQIYTICSSAIYLVLDCKLVVLVDNVIQYSRRKNTRQKPVQTKTCAICKTQCQFRLILNL